MQRRVLKYQERCRTRVEEASDRISRRRSSDGNFSSPNRSRWSMRRAGFHVTGPTQPLAQDRFLNTTPNLVDISTIPSRTIKPYTPPSSAQHPSTTQEHHTGQHYYTPHHAQVRLQRWPLPFSIHRSPRARCAPHLHLPMHPLWPTPSLASTLGLMISVTAWRRSSRASTSSSNKAASALWRSVTNSA